MDSESMIFVVAEESSDIIVVDGFFNSCVVEGTLGDSTVGWHAERLGWR